MAVTLQRGHCFQRRRLLRLSLRRERWGCSSPAGLGALSCCFLLGGRKELAASDPALLQELASGSTERLEGRRAVLLFVSRTQRRAVLEGKRGLTVRLTFCSRFSHDLLFLTSAPVLLVSLQNERVFLC